MSVDRSGASAASKSALVTAAAGGHGMTYQANQAHTLANLDINAEVKFDRNNEDLQELG